MDTSTRRSPLGWISDRDGTKREIAVAGDALDLSGVRELPPAAVADLERLVGDYWKRLAAVRAAALVRAGDPRVPEVRAELAGFMAAGRPVTLEDCDWADITSRLAQLGNYGNGTLRQFAAEVYGPGAGRGLWTATPSSGTWPRSPRGRPAGSRRPRR